MGEGCKGERGEGGEVGVRARGGVWEARARQMARWEMLSRRREEDARRREVETRDERRY